MNEKYLILGVGNTLLSDEGFGIRALGYLATHYKWPQNATLTDGGTGGLLLMADLMGCDRAAVLDICKIGSEPGTIYSFSADAMETAKSFPQSAHSTNINDILSSCELAGQKPETHIFALEPFDYQTVSSHLSKEAQKLLPVFCEKVVQELRKMWSMEITKITS